MKPCYLIFLIISFGMAIGCTIPQQTTPSLNTQPPVSSPPNDFLVYTDTVNGFSIAYPKDWDEIPRKYWEGLTEEGEVLIAFWSPTGQLNFVVQREKLLYPMTLQDYYEGKREKVKERSIDYFGHYDFIAEEKLTVDSMPSIKYIFNSATMDGRPMKCMHVYIVEDQTAWAITFSGAPASFDKLLPTLNQIASSFSLER